MDQVIYGIKPVIEALRAPETRIREILVSRSRQGNVSTILELASQRGLRVRYRERHELGTLSKGGSHQGVLAVVEGFDYANCDDILRAWRASGSRALILVLDSIQDPQNLGALIRTANVSGAHGVIIPKNRAARVTPSVVKASAGATAFTPVARVTNLVVTMERMREEGIWIIGTAPEAPISLFEHDFTTDTAVVMGSEDRGIRPRVLGGCDQTVSIPRRGPISSLNVSVAAGVVLYEVIRQRLAQKTGHEGPKGIRKAQNSP